MGYPTQDLNSRLAAAGASARRATEQGIQRVRGWCLVVALVQAALYPGQLWYLAWGAMAVLALNWVWVRWTLDDGAASARPRVAVVGVVAMAGDALAAIMVMANLMASPDDPIQLLPVALAMEAAVRWGRRGGLVGGVASGLLLTGWSVGVHYRNDLAYSVPQGAFRFLIVVGIGVGIGSAMREMRQQRRAAQAVFEASRDLMATFAMDGSLVATNPACEAILGYGAAELPARSRELLPDDLTTAEGLDALCTEGPRRLVQRVHHREGHLLWIELDLVPDRTAGLIYAIGRDVSDRSRAESELRHRVDHDSLTGAWNRRALLAYLDRMMGRGYQPALVFIDVDDFKQINDLHGHLVGDAVIVELARRLSDSAGQDGTVARYAGDEFCIAIDDPDELGLVAARARTAFAAPFVVDGTELVVRGSVGAAPAAPGETPESLVRRADLAMYEVKRATRLAG